MTFIIGRGFAEYQSLKEWKWHYLLLLTWARQRDCQMSVIISRGYAEVQIWKTSESDPLSFWNILIGICPILKKKSKTEMDITHFHL